MEAQDFDIKAYLGQSVNVLDHGSVVLVDGMTIHPHLKIVNAARVSFGKSSETLDKDGYRLIKYLNDNKHYSPFRHSYFTFRIKAPLFVFKQLWKHQIGNEWIEKESIIGSIEIPDTSWNEESGRYAAFGMEFYVPEVIRKQDTANKQASNEPLEDIDGVSPRELYLTAMREIEYQVRYLLEHKAAREQVQRLLPQNVYSACYWTVSLQAVHYLLSLRLKNDTQWETQEYARAIRSLLDPILRGIEYWDQLL